MKKTITTTATITTIAILAIFTLQLTQLTQLTNATLTIQQPPQITLKTCQTGQVILQVENTELKQQAKLQVQPTEKFINAKYSQLVNLKSGRNIIPILLQTNCDFGIVKPGTHPINFILSTSQTTTRATTMLKITSENNLFAQLQYKDAASCTCKTANFQLQITNYGSNTEIGNIITSSPNKFKTAINDNTFEIQPGQTTNRQIAVAIPCKTQNNAYSLNVVIARESEKNQPILQLQSAFITQQCKTSKINGPTYIELCQGQLDYKLYTLTNADSQKQTYEIQTTFGNPTPTQIQLEPRQTANFALTFNETDTNESIQGQFALTTITKNQIEQKAIRVKVAQCANQSPNINETINTAVPIQTNNANATIANANITSATGLFTSISKPQEAIPILITLLLLALIIISLKYISNQRKIIYTEEKLSEELRKIALKYNEMQT